VLTPTLQIAGIEANVDGGYNLALLSQFDKQGPCFDYLINGLSTTDALIVAQYTTNGAQNIKVLDRCYYPLKSNADSVVTDWNSGYRNSYIK
jgi:hypothetical protein